MAEDPTRSEVRSNLGAVLARLGRYDDAIEQYRAALHHAPAAIAPQLRFNLALAYYKSFRIGEAAAELDALHSADAGNVNVSLLLADCRLRTGEYWRAVDILLPIESSHPDQPAIDYVLGMAFIRLGQTAEGQKRVERILGRGDSAEGHFLLGAALFQSGNYPAAVAEFAKAVALNPDLPSLQSYYGQTLLFTGDADGATAAFRKELAANPNDFDANFQLASILWHRGKKDDARPLLERAVRVRPGSEAAREALAHGFTPLSAGATDSGVSKGVLAPSIAGIDLRHLDRPLVLVFGSYTCPQLRSSAGALKAVSEKHRGDVEFRLVYIREAHAGAEWQSTINEREKVALAAPRTLDEKRAHAELCVRKLELPWQAVVDGMDGQAESAYQAWPSRVYVIDREGRIAYNSRLGELEFHPAELEAVLREILSRGATDARRH